MIKDSVYIITGGASGLGLRCAETLLEEGAYLTIIDLQLPEKGSVLRNSEESAVLLLQVDVTSEKDILNAIDATKRKFGKLNGIINCPGIFTDNPAYNNEKEGPHCLKEFTKIIDVNLIGTFNVTRSALPVLIQNESNSEGERGIIINTSSAMGHQRGLGRLAYWASKSGIIGMTSSLARELSSLRIRVLSITSESPTEECKEFGNFVKTIINENTILSGTSLKFDGIV